jgi:hypothetical protein
MMCSCGVGAEVNLETWFREMEAEFAIIVHFLFQQPLIVETHKWSLLYDMPTLFLDQQNGHS